MFTRISKGVLIFYFIAVVFTGLALLAGDKGEKEIGAIVLGAGLVVGYGFGLFVELINNVLDVRINSEKILSKMQSYEQNSSLLGNGSNSTLSNYGSANTSAPYSSVDVSNSSFNLMENAKKGWICMSCNSTNESSYNFCIKCGARR